MEDKRLWEHIKYGDKKALKKLHDKYFKQMCLYTQKSVTDTSVVEELVSDCFIKLWENRAKININSSVKHYIFFILRNSVVDYYREKRPITESIENIPEPANEEYFDEQKQYAKLYDLIQKLPDQRKKIIELAVFDSLTYNEIAKKLNITKNTVKTQIGRAYRFFKENLDPKDFYLFYFLHTSEKNILSKEKI
ncbi:sigma-70 family RNA polymerase sigma factor [Maribellus comscasis]|uniref:Sigma-70 family RNA polymerase sigma factor n=1 Tax=Maribellus comscasis TaxID=2681766 RepID=A0A6I6JLX6_9BACT|nr:sigma-70 family RNA polymerase sigma factor [Maribellus comscasis]QGY42219.1 sigma-70 family RNA polymerase sigma factor [Maribellus comscasis]